ncbi:unnamed protein product [Arabis nemorensis]|uniref:TF-B3 domain-containing protein n=1 Tax=Arabis nemorensis TaxID=586526 RepID=A0A565CAU4_9BRAS|nr:unnamed protein product [Arabis nemorensis]
MADPPRFSLFQQNFHTGDNPYLKLDDQFLRTHMKVLLRSDASERIWEVKLDGNRLAGGWEEFVADNKFRDGDVLVFRHDGDENFHGTFWRRRIRNQKQDLSRNFTVSFGEHNKTREIDLVNEQGRRWTPVIAKNSSSGVFYIRRGGGCSNGKSKSDGVSEGKKKTPSPFLKLELTPNRYKNGQLYLSSPFTTENGINKPGEVTLLNKDGRKWSSNLHMTGDVRRRTEWFYLRRGWREMCEANGVKVNDSFVLELIWEDANPMFKFHSKIENHEKKDKMNCKNRKKRACEADLLERAVEKTPRVEIEGRRVSRIAEHHDDDEKRGGTRISNRLTITNSRKSQYTQPKSCTVSDQVTNVKRSIVDTLNTVRQLRSELKTRERNLEASLLEIDALGERILGISQILNNKLV